MFNDIGLVLIGYSELVKWRGMFQWKVQTFWNTAVDI